LTVLSIAFGSGRSIADEAVYEKQIKPLLKERCYSCHGALKQEANLRLDTAALMIQGGDSGQAILPGTDAANSLLLERVSAQDESMRMPPLHEGEILTADQIAILQAWIENGATVLADEKPESDPHEHWSFRPLVKPTLPELSDSAWSRNAIDQWIAVGHKEQGLAPQPEASRELLLRRLTLDLIGVLPTAQEIASFENDPAADWYEKTVERLLNDPRHGERWARHWMDNWRYSDWWGLGEELRNSQRHIWHWRDWIIESINDDVPYDEMVRQMLAADEIYPNDPDKVRATGYLARNYFIFNRTQWLDETVEHVNKSLLGLTMNCAKCHDHKFDPISQVDYYKMRAFFEPYHVRTDFVSGQIAASKDGIPRAFDGKLDAATYLFIRGDEAKPDKSRVIDPGVPEILASEPLTIHEVQLPAEAYEPQRKPGIVDAYMAQANEKLQASQNELLSTNEKLATAQSLLNSLKEQPDVPQTLIPAYEDNFSQLDDSRWNKQGGTWIHEPGKLAQTTDGAQQSALQYLATTPVDFDATLKFTIHGGSQWRSVGIGFDAGGSKSKSPEYLAYVSGAAGQSKVQVSYTQGDAWQYPAEAAKPMTIEIGREYTLRVQARGSLINVYLDGERVIAWQSPLGRQGGSIQIVTFYALASVHRFGLAQLDNQTALHDPKTNESVFGDPVIAAERELQRLQQAQSAAQHKYDIDAAELDSVSKRAAAFTAQWQGGDSLLIDQSHRDAVKSERYLALLKAKQATLQAEATMNAASDANRDAEKKKYDDALAAQTAADTAFNADVAQADPITPFVGAKWAATRFQDTTKDDPAVSFPATSTGRRKALALWITSPQNPLAARVAVNHIWSRHLDQPLAANTFDLGRNSASPSNPELLDWLATELIEHGWSMKHIHRLIVNSATYRMSSSVAGAEQKLTKDPDNRYWWRRTPIRLEAEVIRDSLLAMSGSLETQLGGPSVMPADQDNSKRRSVYFFHSNNDRNLFLTTFDEALVTECYRREQSIVPQQALALSNSALVIDASRDIAAHISSTAKEDRDFIKTAFKVILAMKANEEEISAALQTLQQLRQEPNVPPDQARANLVWALLNHNDFVTLR
jgi:hypothetical protein